MKNAKNILFGIFAVLLALYCIFFGGSVKAAVSDGIVRCLTTVIPALYAMMAVSGLLLRSGAVSAAGRFLAPVGKLFGLSGEFFCIFLFSMIAGYPVGGRMIYARYKDGDLGKHDGELLAGLCFGSGIPFIFGCVSANRAAGRLILASTVTAQFILLLAMAPYFRRHFRCTETPRKTAFSAEIFTDSVSSAGRGMAEVCFCVIAFGVLTAMLRDLGIMELLCRIFRNITGITADGADSVICALLDVTAVPRLSGMGSGQLPVTAGLVSFGGICVFMQIGGIFRGRLRMLPMIGMRTAAAVLSGLLCRLMMPLFPDDTVTAAAISGKMSSCPSPVPSVILVIMTGMVIRKSSSIKKIT